jgi:hypothetical protein
VPYHSTASRRAATLPAIRSGALPEGPLHVLTDSTRLAVYGAGQWLEEKHGRKSRRGWRKLHLAVDAGSGVIVARTLTDQDRDDPSQVGPQLDRIDGPIARVTAEGAYDGTPTYHTIAAHGGGIEVVIPPRATAARSGRRPSATGNLETIATQGRLSWQAATGYGRRARVVTTMGGYKALIRIPLARSWFCRTAGRGRHRRRRPQPHVAGRTPGLRPMLQQDSIATGGEVNFDRLPKTATTLRACQGSEPKTRSE